MKNTIKFLAFTALAFVAAICVPFTAFCQDVVNVVTPQDFTNPTNVNALQTGLTVLLAYLAGFIPGVAKIKPYVRAIIAGLVTVAGFATFKLGFLTEEFVTYVLAAFLPNFAFAGITWETLKFILGVFKVKLPGTSAAG